MDLIIESSDIRRTRILAGNSNELVYDIMTDRKFLSQAPTIIYKYNGENKFEVARIEWATWHETKIICHGQQIYLESPGMFSL
jgi:hypothetical protein